MITSVSLINRLYILLFYGVFIAISPCSALDRMVIVHDKKLSFAHAESLLEVKNSAPHIHLLLRSKERFPTLNIISLARKYSDSVEKQQEWLIESYRDVGLTDVSLDFFRKLEKANHFGFEGQLTFSQEGETRVSKVLIIPYLDFQIVITYLDRKGENYPLWAEIRDTLDIPDFDGGTTTPAELAQIPILIIIVTFIFLMMLCYIVFARRRA